MINKEKLFGTTAIQPTSNFLFVFIKIFTLQRVLFWVLTYVLSAIFLTFFDTHNDFIDFFNLILFPFTVILMGTVANRFILSMPLIYKILYPSFKLNLSKRDNRFIWVITNVAKSFIYVKLWKFTFVLGIVGFALHFWNAKKFVK